MARLHTSNLSFRYEHDLIIDELDVTIPAHQITTIIGPNGCGKSTLLKSMSRILQPQQGKILLNGQDIEKQHTKELAKQMAILPQSNNHTGGLTVGELVSYGRFPYQKGFGRLSSRDYEVINWAMEMTGVHEFKYRSVDALSGGQRQRVWIAMALAQETELIFLDEPTTYLDLAHQLEVLELLKELNIQEHRTIVMVLHDLNQAARFADYIIAMRDGKIVESGTSHQIISNEVLREVFQIDAHIANDPKTNRPICMTYDLIKGEKKNEKTTHTSNLDAVINY
ncbi:ABC transporter ATP-binding protein [Halalkalibacillus halophilus]|uniref:ABC transporter ATP-binding protein n=1 Tax=Halalkalibacillus halophilus TaxID=392827 RepID=UPI00040CDA72|nr:ABC transporter ATP-binding protein [Halalkalibacillus halophilus]